MYQIEEPSPKRILKKSTISEYNFGYWFGHFCVFSGSISEKYFEEGYSSISSYHFGVPNGTNVFKNHFQERFGLTF